jgi:hypothetical protein
MDSTNPWAPRDSAHVLLVKNIQLTPFRTVELEFGIQGVRRQLRIINWARTYCTALHLLESSWFQERLELTVDLYMALGSLCLHVHHEQACGPGSHLFDAMARLRLRPKYLPYKSWAKSWAKCPKNISGNSALHGNFQHQIKSMLHRQCTRLRNI